MWLNTWGCLGVLLVPLLAGTCTPTVHPPVRNCRVVNVYPHDTAAFTEGLIFNEGHLYESVGVCGESALRKVRLETGAVVAERRLSKELFAEGLTLWRAKLFQLTWQSETGFVYSAATMGREGAFHIAGECWGLTHDGAALIVSDGTATLRFLDPLTLTECRRIMVRSSGQPVGLLNELEFVDGCILANILNSSHIARIEPSTGEVVEWIDLGGLLRKGEVTDPEAVPNGIAYDSARHRLFVTGKLWPKIFEIVLADERAKPQRCRVTGRGAE